MLLFPPGTLAVSIYESGSNDKTPYWLDVLKLLAAPLGIPSRIVTQGGVQRS